jgi:Ca-activated chloride channel homolog
MRSSAASWWVSSALAPIILGAVFLSPAFSQSAAGNQPPAPTANPNSTQPKAAPYGAPGTSSPQAGNSTSGNAPPQPTAPLSSQGSTSQVPAADQSPISPEPGSGDQGGMFVFKKQVEEVVLHATVYDQGRNLVTGLSRSDFSVFENGIPQTITSFRREDVPVALGIVVDNSGSMRDKRDKVEQAVLNLIRASNPQDQIFVVNFGERPYLDQDFTSNENLLQAALHQVSFKGSTALYDAVVASDLHLKQDSNLEKKVLLVITDGEDNMSVETLQDASRKLEEANGPVVYAVGLLGGGMQQSGRDALQDLASGTGGVAYFPDSLDQVENITRTVAHDIRTQYRIAYRPTNQNVQPQFKSVRVEAQAPGYSRLTVRTRSGYYPSQSGH